MEFMVKHPNYAGMPDPFKSDGTIRWVVLGKSELGTKRLKWWDQKRESLGIPRGTEWQSRVSRANHPTGEKPCQVCGRVMKLDYVYPTKNTIKRINRELLLPEPISDDDLLDISEIAVLLRNHFGEDRTLSGLKGIFGIPSKVAESMDSYLQYVLREKGTMFSPGAMSDCPDRFDGYHTYNKCCRSKEDKGRFAENLRRYGEDRRVYEYWSDGDWKAVAWLMKRFGEIKQGVCSICGKRGEVTADHLGPVSLGFSLGDSPALRTACRSCNSSRNNRMTLKDIQEITELEKKGAKVASWHTKRVWDALKSLPRNDEAAKSVSRLMRLNLHYALTTIGLVAEAGYNDFLKERFLHPEYALYTIEFIGFDPTNGTYERMEKTLADRTEQKRNAVRYERISFEALSQYLSKDNRKIPRHRLAEVNRLASDVISRLSDDDEDGAIHMIEEALGTFAEWALTEFRHEHAPLSNLTDFE